MVCREGRSITARRQCGIGIRESVPDHTVWRGPGGNDPSQRHATGNRCQALKVSVVLENYLSPDGWSAPASQARADKPLTVPPPARPLKEMHTHTHARTYAHKHTHVHAHTHLYTHTHTNACNNVCYRHMHTKTLMHTHTHRFMHTNIYRLLHTHMH